MSTGTASSRAARAGGADITCRYAAAPPSRLRRYAGTASCSCERGRRQELQAVARRAAARQTAIQAAARQPAAQREAAMRAERDNSSPAADSAAATTTTIALTTTTISTGTPTSPPLMPTLLPHQQHHHHRPRLPPLSTRCHYHYQHHGTTTPSGCYPSTPTTPAHIAQGSGTTFVGKAAWKVLTCCLPPPCKAGTNRSKALSPAYLSPWLLTSHPSW